MSEYIVCTDSGCDLSIHVLREHGIIPIRLKYEIDGQIFEDTMLPEDCHVFYEKMRGGAVPKTSQLNIADFMEFWRPLLGQRKPIVHISLGSGVSGTWHNGCLAAEELKQEFPDSEIHVIDSTLCSVGYGMLALKAAELRDKGASAGECVAWLEANKASVNTWYTTDELKYLYRSGRVSRAGMIVGTALNICPILDLDKEGHLLVQEKVRGLKKTVKRIHEIVGERVLDAGNQTAYICHSDIPEQAEQFGEGLKEEFGFREMRYTNIGPTIGSNCGPGLMAVFFWGRERDMKGYRNEQD
ncbi:MAG: DegV family protein [Oscillospiraceae bacterium]|nr:DegV family protein [Oscillospiraceae bacterium]